jgi:hypothetical protein
MTPRLLAAAIVLSSSLGARASDVSPETRTKIESWFRALGAPRGGETFGGYLARAAYLQHGVPYEKEDPYRLSERETLRVDLERFECVSFIESSIAVARCGWAGESDPSCFEREVLLSRYRGGRLSDYSSRLHYFVDWIYDNESRGRLRNLTESLGGEPVRKDFYHLTGRLLVRPEHSELRRRVRDVEESLSGRSHFVLPRERAPRALAGLSDGDLVAFVRERPGLLVHHAGFVRNVRGHPRLLHASSYHERVVLTPDDVTSYLLRRPERKGVIVARPAPPSSR